MGGSGGFFDDNNLKKPEDYKILADKIKASVEKTVDDQFEAEVSCMINKLLVSYNDRDTELIQQYINTITSALGADVDGVLSIKYGGSVEKNTYVEGLSDIDALVLLNDTNLEPMNPETVKDYFFNKLNQRYPNTNIKKGTLSITIEFSDNTIVQLLPAVKIKSGYKIPSANGGSWSEINPNLFVLSLRAVNRKLLGKLVPTIKIAKAIIANLPKNRQITGYHCEALAISIFSNYNEKKHNENIVEIFV